MNFLNLGAEFFLLLGKEFALIIAFLFFSHFIDKQKSLHILGLMLFTMAYNTWLKELFQVPLSSSLGKEGFAFPSGHAHTMVVFWGGSLWLSGFQKTLYRILIASIIAVHGWALIYKGYHHLSDVLGAWAFGSLSLGVYFNLLKKMTSPTQERLALFGLLMLSFLLQFYLRKLNAPTDHLYIATGGLLGLCCGSFLPGYALMLPTFRIKSLALLASLLGVTLIYWLIGHTLSFELLANKNFILFSSLGLWFAGSQSLFLCFLRKTYAL